MSLDVSAAEGTGGQEKSDLAKIISVHRGECIHC